MADKEKKETHYEKRKTLLTIILPRLRWNNNITGDHYTAGMDRRMAA